MEYFNKVKDAVNSYVGSDVEKAILEATSLEYVFYPILFIPPLVIFWKHVKIYNSARLLSFLILKPT